MAGKEMRHAQVAAVATPSQTGAREDGGEDGLGAGNNAKSALLARGLAEISRLGVAMGARLLDIIPSGDISFREQTITLVDFLA